MKKIIVFILTVGLVSNCSKNDEKADVNIRVSNVSNFNFENIIVNPGASNNVEYGNLDVGMSSDYRNFEKAYSYGFIQLTANGEEYSLIPIDYVGESTLSDGNYTYQLDLVDTEAGFLELRLYFVQD